ncbi:MAG TPA: DUF397 domain-containing protein [Streptosporangiaceae bacterium]
MTTPDRLAPQWRKSSQSGGDEGACVELSGLPGAVAVRDSKDPDGPRLVLPRPAFRALLTHLKTDDTA